MPTPTHFEAAPQIPDPVITLIGMPGAGKSTVGALLAAQLGWAFVDGDFLIEAVYGTNLQQITDALSKEAFLDTEATVLSSLRVSRAVIATGGSVVYREKTMRHLASMGPIVFLDVPFPLIEERVARNPDRGIAMNPGERLEDIFRERQALYTRYADLRCPSGNERPEDCATWIREHLQDRLDGQRGQLPGTLA